MPSVRTADIVVISATAIAIVSMLIDPAKGVDVAKTIGIGLVGFLGSEATKYRNVYKSKDDNVDKGDNNE